MLQKKQDKGDENLSSSLDKLVYIYSLDTSSFYNEEECEIDKKLIKLKQYKSLLMEIIKPLNSFRLKTNKLLKAAGKDDDIRQLEDNLIIFYNKFLIFKDQINDYLQFNEKNNTYIINTNSTLYLSEQHLNKGIIQLKELLDKEAENHKGMRKLREDSLKDSNKISLFESTLTRSLKINENELSTDIIVIRAYRYIIFEELVKNGFMFNNEVYEYFASSAGQIRTKKSCFIRKSALNENKHETRNKLMCGLSINKINKLGGINPNKFQAYLSLVNSASKKWIDFDIDKCIVVDDMELKVKGLVDLINHENYKIKRVEKEIEINFMDGAGIMLPSVNNKSLQFRMPWFKGLLIPFSYRDFIFEHDDADWNIKDIFGKEYNILKEDIRIIFTKSQFKLHGYYKNWDEYKEYFKKFNCEASICKIEEDTFEDKPINYQMIQSLNFSNKELEELSSKTIEDILNIGENKDVMLRLLGANENEKRQNYFQKSLSIYHPLLNDEHSKQAIKDRKKSLVKDAKAGKILLEGTKRSYISPDLYAFAEWLFSKKIQPKGLLNNGEVSCKLFENEKLDILRSPHLFREHCTRQNILNKKTEKWFISNCIYTSVHDMISKQLMFDVDGDDALIVCNKPFTERAERQMIRTVPLEYTLASSKKYKITNDKIVESLKAAYSKNIGEISNLITKIWNCGKVLNKKDIDLIKILCMENNAVIDFAKTLWMPIRPKPIENQIKKYNQMNLPFFFKFAKDKTENQVAKINSSTMNKLTEIIPDKRINFISVAGKFDYKNLMKNKRQKIDDELSRKIIDTYTELDRSKTKEVKNQVKESDKIKSNVELKVYQDIRRKLLQVTNNPNLITDVLVKYLFGEKKSPFKDTLWNCFGKEIHRNIEYNVLNIKRCLICKIEIENINKKKYCDDCFKESRKKYIKEKVKQHRDSRKCKQIEHIEK